MVGWAGRSCSCGSDGCSNRNEDGPNLGSPRLNVLLKMLEAIDPGNRMKKEPLLDAIRLFLEKY